MAGLQSGEGCMMIDCFGTVNQRDRHTDSHVAVENAVKNNYKLVKK